MMERGEGRKERRVPADMQIRAALVARGHCLVGSRLEQRSRTTRGPPLSGFESRTDFSSHLNPKLTDKREPVSVDYVVVSDSQ